MEDRTKDSRRDSGLKAEDYSGWRHLQHSRNYLYGLEVDELVHQQQGTGQVGQAGLRAATVTARVTS